MLRRYQASLIGCLGVAVASLVISSCAGVSPDVTAGGTMPQVLSSEAKTAATKCHAQVDGKVYTHLFAAQSIESKDLKRWLRGRSDVYSPSRLSGIPDGQRVVVCELAAPGLKLPLPPNSDEHRDTRVALVLLGLTPTPRLDSVGPQSRIDDLMASLP